MAKTAIPVIEFQSNWTESNHELTFRAKGRVNTIGWNDPELQMEVDGDTMSFKLVADEPTGFTNPTISYIEASRTFKVQIENWEPNSQNPPSR